MSCCVLILRYGISRKKNVKQHAHSIHRGYSVELWVNRTGRIPFRILTSDALSTDILPMPYRIHAVLIDDIKEVISYTMTQFTVNDFFQLGFVEIKRKVCQIHDETIIIILASSRTSRRVLLPTCGTHLIPAFPFLWLWKIECSPFHLRQILSLLRCVEQPLKVALMLYPVVKLAKLSQAHQGKDQQY